MDEMNSLCKYFLFSIIAICSVIACDTAANIESPDKNFFVKFYGDDGDQKGVDMIALSDGTFLLLGNSELSTFSGFQKRIYLVKVDSEGKIIWQKKLGSLSDVAKDIEPTNDGNFIILSQDQTLTDNYESKLLKINQDGNVLDSVVYGTSKNDEPKSITPLLDGGFIITGSTFFDQSIPPDPAPFPNIFHSRSDANLNFDKTWYETYGAADKFDVGTKTIEDPANNFLIFGYSNREHDGRPFIPGRMNLQYYSIGSGGISNNVSFLGDFNEDTRSTFAMRVAPELGGGYLLMATKTSNTGAITIHVSKLRSPLQFDPVNDIQFEEEVSIDNRTLESVSAASLVHGPSQGYLLLADEVRSIGTNIWLTKINLSGRQEWSVSLGSEEENDKAAAATELNDGRIMILGTVGIGDNQSKMALFKLNSYGRLQD